MTTIGLKPDPANPPPKGLLVTTNKTCYSATESMMACQWNGKENVTVVQRPKPVLTEPLDAIIRITSTTVCGSDLHMYFDLVPGEKPMQPGDILGHEGMGIVESVGPGVKDLHIGDRVVVSAVIACGQCDYCQKKEFSCCDRTNPSGQMEKLYGHRTSGIFGYSHLTGAFDGCQAEYVRVPLADVNCLKVPPTMSDEQVLFLSDILCTGWHGNELANVKSGDTVCIWGCGPVGLAAMLWARFRGASRVISIDSEPYRLELASKLGAEVINFSKCDVVECIQKVMPGGPDACIDCVGFRFPKSEFHKSQFSSKQETDALDIINEMVKLCRKNGHIALIGDYFGWGNQFPIGALMEKGIHMRGSQVFVQKYWKELLGYIQSGNFDPTTLVSHVMPFDKASEAYRMFSRRQDNVIKIVLKTKAGMTKR